VGPGFAPPFGFELVVPRARLKGQVDAMPVAKGHRVIAKAALLVAACFCLLSMAQVARPLCSIDPNPLSALSAPQQQLTRHALQEVSPRSARPQAPHVICVLPVAPVNHHCEPPRLTRSVAPLWPIENWLVHRQIAPASADNPEPA